jgi:hypothetical protein
MNLRDVEMRQVVAQRVLILAPDGQVTARIGLPFTPDDYPKESWCPWQIEGIASGRVRAAVGVDAVQALSLAMRALGSDLYASEEYRCGRLMAFPGEAHGDLGFPRWTDPDLPPPV